MLAGVTGILPLAILAGLGAVIGACGRRVLTVLPQPVTVRPPWCELVTAAAWLVTGWPVAVYDAPAARPGALAPALALAALGVPLAAADLTQQRLPNALTGAGYPLLCAAAVLAATERRVPETVARAAIGGLALGGFYLLVWLARPSALGAGDVKLAGGLGVALGSLGWLAAPLSVLLAAFASILHAALSRGHRRAVPHGPAMLLAGWAIAALSGAAGGAM
jgi:leader peptidase (prepilin peptidase)/N-methyltransferase